MPPKKPVPEKKPPAVVAKKPEPAPVKGISHGHQPPTEKCLSFKCWVPLLYLMVFIYH